MKKTLKPIGLAAIIAAIVFSLAACSDGGGSAAPTLTGITAAYTQTAAVYPDTPLDSLKAGLTVTANYSDNTSKAVTNYTLSGALTAGTSTITVTYEGKTATFTVTVTGSTPVSADITYTAAQDGGVDGEADTTGIVFTFSESVDSLNLTAADIAVSGNAAKGADAELTGTGAERTLAVTVSGAGPAVVQITKDGIEAETKNVTVYKAGEAAPTLTGIMAAYTQTETVYPDTPLDDLKTELTVTARYSNGDEVELGASEYALSGELTVGESEVTAAYQGETATFTVTVSAAPAAKTLTGITLNTDTVKKAYANNDKLNLANLTVTANYSDSSSAAVTEYTANPANGEALGTTGNITVTISYTEGGVTKTADFTVTVTKTLTKITLNTDEVTKDYAQNETLTLTGLVVTATYSDSSSAAVTNYTADPEDGTTLDTIGDNITVTISYKEGNITKTADFTVTVTIPPYIINGSGTAFTATRDGATVGTAGQPIQNVINDIRADADGEECTIQFGNLTDTLDIGAATASFNNTGGTWGEITLKGKITGNVNTATTGTIVIADTVSITSTADIANTGGTNGRAVYHNSTGTVSISGGTVSGETGRAIHNQTTGTVTISGGTVSATTGTAVSGSVNVSGTALVTSANTNASGGTITTGPLVMTGGKVENTSTTTGSNAVYTSNTTTISGGTISAIGGAAVLVYTPASSQAKLTVSGTALVTSANSNASAALPMGTIGFYRTSSGGNVGTTILEITGGTVENTSNSFVVVSYMVNGTVNISGGTVSGGAGIGGPNASLIVNISGGTITGTDNGVVTPICVNLKWKI